VHAAPLEVEGVLIGRVLRRVATVRRAGALPPERLRRGELRVPRVVGLRLVRVRVRVRLRATARARARVRVRVRDRVRVRVRVRV